MTKPTPKPTKAKHPFPKAVHIPGFLGGLEQLRGRGVTAYLHDDEAAGAGGVANRPDCVAEYTLTRVLKVNRGVTFEEVK